MHTMLWLFLGVVWIAATLLVVLLVRRAAAKGDFAPGWRIRCLTCGRHRDAFEAGIIRIGAYGTKYTLARCSDCGRLRWAAIERCPAEGKATGDRVD
jgi:hypothetical protein